MDKLHYYFNTGLKFQLIHDLREDFYDEDITNIESFNKGSIWAMAGYSDVSIPLGEGDFHGILLKRGHDYCCVGNSAKPLMRPLSSLTKPITVEGYNGGEPFYALLHLVDPDKKDWDKMSVIEYNPFPKIPDHKKWVKVVHEELGEIIQINPRNILVLPFYLAIDLIKMHFWLFDQSEFGKSLIEIKE